MNHHAVLFSDELGCIKGVHAKIHVDASVSPKYFRARSIPYALRGKVEDELERLQEKGVIEPVSFSEWAAPVVPVMKGDGSIRICGDYKITVNQGTSTEKYQLPRIDDLLASLSGGKSFSKLDLAQAYLQIPLEETSKKYTTINTQKGLFQYTRLPFGIASAPAIFQRTIEGVLRGIPHVCVYIDDILITGSSQEDHLERLGLVLQRLQDFGFRLRRVKCAFFLQSVEYLGHVITAEGLKPCDKKVRAIIAAPSPKDISQLRSFLGLMNYYKKFLPNLSSILSPLYELLHKQRGWAWKDEQSRAFKRAKELLTSDHLLVHFDPVKDIIVSCDASPYGIGAVLSHRLDGIERPIYLLRGLSLWQRRDILNLMRRLWQSYLR